MEKHQRLAAAIVSDALAGRNLGDLLQALWARQPALEPAARATVQDLCYGSLRHYGLLAAELDRLLDRPLSDARLRGLLLVALYQLQFSRAARHAVVDQAVRAAARLQPAARGLVNAVLRNFLRQADRLAETARAEDETARWNFPAWWIDRLRQDYPADWQAVLASAARHPPMTLRVNARRGDVASYRQRLEEAGMAARRVGEQGLILEQPVAVGRLPGFADGDVSVQDAGAQLAARLLAPRDGQRLLDACAAPGGKTTHLLELAEARLTALDADAARLARVRENLARLGQSATLLTGDAGRPEDWWDGVPYDAILADVPCSASGVVRRQPDIKWNRRPTDLAGFAARQATILDGLWRCLAPGGKLLYATCSVFAEENVRQIEAFLGRHGDARGAALAEGGPTGWQILPDAERDGFFYALLCKTH